MAESLAVPEQMRIKIVNADDHRSCGRYDEAEELQKAILEEMVTSRGLEDRETLWAKARLSQTYLCKGDYGKAEEAQTELLGQCETLFGWSDPNTHRVASLLITTFHAKLDFYKAKVLVDRLLSHQQKIYQGSSPEILDTQATLARTIHGQGKFREAAAMRLNLLDQRKARMTIDDPRKLAEALWDHAQSLLTLDKPSEARAPLEEAIRTSENLFGPEDSHVLSGRAELAKLHLCEMRFLEAVRVGHEVLEVQERTLGAKHPDTISSMSNQSVYLWHASLPTHSKSMIDRALALANEHFGKEDIRTISVLSNAAGLYRRLGFFDRASEMAEANFESSRRLKGDDDLDTLNAIAEHCQCLWLQGKRQTAIQGMRLCVLRTRRKFPEGHPLAVGRAEELAELEALYRLHEQGGVNA